MAQLIPRSEIDERNFNRLIVGGVTLGFLALLAVGIAATLTILENQRHTRWIAHTYQVERQISKYRVLLERSEAARRGLLLSDEAKIRRTFRDAVDRIPRTLDDVRDLTKDNPRQQATTAALQRLTGPEIALMRESDTLVGRGQRAEAVSTFKVTRGLGLVRAIRGQTDAMLAEEDRLLDQRDTALAQSLRLFFAILIAAAMLLVIVGVATVWVILRYTRDLSASQAALRALNENLEGAVRERTTDLQRANEEIQRFAYIVSHDLRSPLVNVMGFTAELQTATTALTGLIDRAEAKSPDIVTPEARAAAREDLPEAIGFIRSSTQKMDRLINAILRLSREGRRPITPERIDMDAMAQGIADSLRHRALELGAEIALAPRLPAIVSDRLAVEQILSNIVENALKYLKPGVPGRIAITGAVERDRTILTIADNGRGIDPRDHDRIFDLFRRSGTQDQPGEGIGLAHTRALAYRLGGSIAVQSALGEGATFRITFPLVYGGDQGSLA